MDQLVKRHQVGDLLSVEAIRRSNDRLFPSFSPRTPEVTQYCPKAGSWGLVHAEGHDVCYLKTWSPMPGHDTLLSITLQCLDIKSI
jgi:hypothetical protein